MSAAATPIPTAAAAPPREVTQSGPAKWGGIAFAGVVYAFLYLPVLVMAVFSFSEGSVQSLPIEGFSTKWYEELAGDEEMINALIYSAQVSLIAVTISLVAGTGFAMLFTRLKIRGLSIAQALIALPFVMPGMVLGVSLLLALREIGVEPGLLAIVIAHVTFITPIVIFVVAQRLRTLDPSLEQASQDLGAGPVRTFFNVVFPSIRTTLLAAALLGFTVSFDEVIVTFFVSGSEQTLPVHIWTLLRQGFSPAINAILTLIAVFSIALIAFATVILARSRRAEA